MKDRCREIIKSKLFIILQLALACCVTTLRLEVAGTVAFCCVLSFIFLFSDDVFDTTLPFMLLCLTLIKCFDSFNVFIWLVPVGVLTFAAFLLFVRRNFRLRKPGPTFIGVAAVAAAVTMGGVGIISARAYFSLTSVYYTFAMGVGMAGIYLLMNGLVGEGKREDAEEKFSLIMSLVLVFACFMIAEHYLMNIDKVIKRDGILPFQWRNNACTFIMLCLPYPFALAKKNRLWILAGWAGWGCLLLSGSRGGMLFGTAEMLLCLTLSLVTDKKNRRFSLILIGCFAAIGAVFAGKLLHFNLYTIKRIFDFNENKVRLGLFSRAVEDFRANPVFGSGLANWENRDIHPSVRFALCWYHSAPFQILGSFGLFGAACYACRFFVRAKTIIKNRDPFTFTLAMSFAGLTMMSLVNPGEFCPLPYELMMTLTFILMERRGKEGEPCPTK